MGIQHNYRSKRGERQMYKEQKRLEKMRRVKERKLEKQKEEEEKELQELQRQINALDKSKGKWINLLVFSKMYPKKNKLIKDTARSERNIKLAESLKRNLILRKQVKRVGGKI